MEDQKPGLKVYEPTKTKVPQVNDGDEKQEEKQPVLPETQKKNEQKERKLPEEMLVKVNSFMNLEELFKVSQFISSKDRKQLMNNKNLDQSRIIYINFTPEYKLHPQSVEACLKFCNQIKLKVSTYDETQRQIFRVIIYKNQHLLSRMINFKLCKNVNQGDALSNFIYDFRNFEPQNHQIVIIENPYQYSLNKIAETQEINKCFNFIINNMTYCEVLQIEEMQNQQQTDYSCLKYCKMSQSAMQNCKFIYFKTKMIHSRFINQFLYKFKSLTTVEIDSEEVIDFLEYKLDLPMIDNFTLKTLTSIKEICIRRITNGGKRLKSMISCQYQYVF